MRNCQKKRDDCIITSKVGILIGSFRFLKRLKNLVLLIYQAIYSIRKTRGFKMENLFDSETRNH
jgi:hypothetical protein